MDGEDACDVEECDLSEAFTDELPHLPGLSGSFALPDELVAADAMAEADDGIGAARDK